jgi:hypothetical protein
MTAFDDIWADGPAEERSVSLVTSSRDKRPEPARDLLDFHLRWHEFRPFALQIGERPDLGEVESETLGWLIALSDRVSGGDFGA